ncbi:hypothetical protein IW261DRAFT_1497142 [Armillaria novae-zelandiae]|uniref:Uncharacterized protein n=1 Tax=Armillaria novae-zelandiae TaxID=153914 RepID=A0AA39NZK0_9AGAR|nr:hypothetical protein IW261DRAFT_1497142 [Armillaria novae-zelandiae]
MHLAIAIFLSGLVVFLQPLRAALSWIICAGTVLVYIAYAVATTLPIFFPQCPYRTPLCDLVYTSLCRTVPRVTWYSKEYFLSSLRDRNLGTMFRCLPRVRARTRQSLTAIESKFVRQMSTDLAAEALHWLLSVSSNPSVHSIVLQSIGGLPMASEDKFFNKLGLDSFQNMWESQVHLLEQCLLATKHSDDSYYEPMPGMELKLGRLLRFAPHAILRFVRNPFFYTPGIYSSELTAAILFSGGTLHDRETLNESISLDTFLMDSTRSSKLSPRSWYQLMTVGSRDVFSRLDSYYDDNAMMFPLLLCSTILNLFTKSRKGLTQEFDSPLVYSFEDAIPYLIDKIYHAIPSTSCESMEDPWSLKYLRVLVVATKFLLHRLSLPDYEKSHATILESLELTNECILHATFSSQEATTVMPMLEDIIACSVVPGSDSSWSLRLSHFTIEAYQSLTTVAPSACSLHGLRSTIDFMTLHWDQTVFLVTYLSKHACAVLTDLLAKRTPL